jgi:hypothetical protein
MKIQLENTLENKERFFAIYWGQTIVSDGLEEGEKCTVQFALSEGIHREGWLELKPLSAITDEDAVEVAKIILKGIEVSSNFNYALHGRLFISDLTNQSYKDSVMHVVDHLRSKGYALPYMGLSVEEQISYGWVKLKTE